MQDIHWIYQKRQVDVPWALQLFHVYSKRKPSNQSIEAVLYSEIIDTETHSVPLDLDTTETLDKMAKLLCINMGEYVEVTEEDYNHIRTSLSNIINK